MDFRKFIQQQGFETLAKKIGCSHQTVRDWDNLKTAPRPAGALRLIHLSNGVLTWESIYKPFAQKELHGTSYQVEVNGMTSTMSFDFTKELQEIGYL